LLDIFDVGAWSGLTEVLFMERSLNLLKPGGRMGIVLPEGVLNNSALQKIREYIEGKAKLVNITSIPQDVFIASGATVKPSLIFLKKFSEEELAIYQGLIEETTKEIVNTSRAKVNKLETVFQEEEKKLKGNKFRKELKELKKKYTEDIKQVEGLINAEIKAVVKERFDYPVPIIEVEKAGISSTGAPCENELEEVAIEFRAYRKDNSLWSEPKKETHYPVDNEGNITRLQLIDGTMVSEPEIFYEVYEN
jgi:type I restriction enzyme M protein